MTTVVLTALLILAGCHPASTQRPVCPPPAAGAGSAQLGAIDITLLNASFWRDWMPEVAKPGPDGGSPLHTRMRLRLHHDGKADAKLSFEALLCDEENYAYPLQVNIAQDKMANAWGGVVPADKTIELHLRGDDGPYMAAGSKTRVSMTWRDDSGNTTTLSTPLIQILRTE